MQHVGSPAYSTCGQQGVAVKPAAGDALLFFSQTAANGLDDLSLHSGCPVIRGNKWYARLHLGFSPVAVILHRPVALPCKDPSGWH